jgi:hypothetical protein
MVMVDAQRLANAAIAPLQLPGAYGTTPVLCQQHRIKFRPRKPLFSSVFTLASIAPG